MVTLEIVTSEACERCEAATRRVNTVIEKVQADIREVKVTERPVDEHPELVVEHAIMSTPAVIIDGRMVLKGVPSQEELVEAIEVAQGASDGE